MAANDLLGLNIGVLCGGVSPERNISLMSGRAVNDALLSSGLNSYLFDAHKRIFDELLEKRIDIVFMAMHGDDGENGNIQKELELKGIPYTGSGPKACQIAMNKVLSKHFFLDMSITHPNWDVFNNWSEANKKSLTYPVVVKPSSAGSSYGVSVVDNKSQLKKAFDLALKYSPQVIIEDYIIGREVAVGLLGSCALPVIEIKYPTRFYDYEAKYSDVGTEYIFPNDIPEDVLLRIQAEALRIFKGMGCETIARVDFILSGNTAYCLEVNTIPGLTQKSLLPKQARQAGIGFREFCANILEITVTQKKYQNLIRGK